MNQEELVRQAGQAREKAYAPYSRYRVGAALLGKSGRVYTGCNVENASFGSTICAERTATVKAVSDGEREFEAIAVVTLDGGTPCGACRQFLYEFAPPELPVIVADESLTIRKVYSLDELLVDGFKAPEWTKGHL